MLNQCIFYNRVSIKLLICNERYSEIIVNMVNQIICPSYYYLTNSILFFSCKIRILINLNCNLFNFSLFQFCTAMFIVCLPIRIMPLQLMVLQWKICETVFKVGLTTVFFLYCGASVQSCTKDSQRIIGVSISYAVLNF